MDHKQTIKQATIALTEEKGEDLETITVREISKKEGVGLGLVNYHFEKKDKLIELDEYNGYKRNRKTRRNPSVKGNVYGCFQGQCKPLLLV